jgi:hypothetical protein
MTGASQVTFTVRLESGGGVSLEQVDGGFHKSVPPEVVSRSSLLTEVVNLRDDEGVLVVPSGFVEAWLQFAEESYAALAGKSDQGLAVSLMVRSMSSSYNISSTSPAPYPRLLEDTASAALTPSLENSQWIRRGFACEVPRCFSEQACI